MDQPEIRTRRLCLRPFNAKDATRVEEMVGDERIADVTANIPHPYPSGLADKWIKTHPSLWQEGSRATFAITASADTILVGCAALTDIVNGAGELGYWIGVEYWNRGYATEACMALVGFGFTTLKLERIHARVLVRNPASRRVLLKCGFVETGTGTDTCGYRGQNEPVVLFEKIRRAAR